MNPSPASDTRRTVTVSGVGQTSVTPDMAVARLGVQTEAAGAGEALSANNQQMQAVVAGLKAAGVQAADIQTQTLMLQPRYGQETGRTHDRAPVLVGYSAANVVQVRVRRVEDMARLLDAAVQAGSNTIDSIQFEISDPLPAQEQARQAAMHDARRKAEQLASLGQAELGAVISIHEGSSMVGPPRPMAMMKMDMAPVEAGAQTVEVQVQVTFELR